LTCQPYHAGKIKQALLTCQSYHAGKIKQALLTCQSYHAGKTTVEGGEEAPRFVPKQANLVEYERRERPAARGQHSVGHGHGYRRPVPLTGYRTLGRPVERKETKDKDEAAESCILLDRKI